MINSLILHHYFHTVCLCSFKSIWTLPMTKPRSFFNAEIFHHTAQVLPPNLQPGAKWRIRKTGIYAIWSVPLHWYILASVQNKDTQSVLEEYCINWVIILLLVQEIWPRQQFLILTGKNIWVVDILPNIWKYNIWSVYWRLQCENVLQYGPLE